MISFSLRNAIVAILLASVSAKATALDNNEDLHIDEEARVDNVLDVNSRRALTNRIVGGNQAAQGKYPYFVEWVRRGCAASLIHTDIVLTAAHCNGSNLPTGVIVSAYQPGLAVNGAQSRTIVQRVQHPNYSSSTNKNDFLIMRLDSPVTGITPVALNGDSQIPAAGDMLTVIGFGDLKNGGQIYPDFLQEVNVPYVTHSKCNQQYSGSIDEVSMLCAGYDQGGKDSCQGDSGGPIVRIVNGVHTQVGVVSWGDGCALVGKPGVYSRTSGQIAWIQAQVCAMTKTNPKPAYCAGSPTPAPTTQAPTVTPGVTPAPTQAPTVTPGSTRAPTRAPTRRVPTRAPTPSPTAGSGCVDDPTAYFYINGRYRNCAWFAARPTFQDYYCGWDTEPDYYCQKTCDSCWYWGGGRSL